MEIAAAGLAEARLKGILVGCAAIPERNGAAISCAALKGMR